MKKRQVAVGLGSILIAAGAGLLAWKKSEGQRTKFIEQRKQKNKSTDVSNITGKDIYNTITEKDIAYG